MDGLLFALTLVTAVGCGLVGGVFFAFSSFVMQGLGRLRAPEGAAAMQAINVTAVTPAFMTALFGTGVAGAVLTGWGLFELGEPYAGYLVAAGALYLVGDIGLTIGYHVPRNEALARVDPASSEGARLWSRYLVEWTRLNHVRAGAALAAAALLAVALQA
ncbi:MAG: DUF1772 domain-containing protein [Thermoleophilaceae bacterium]